VARERAMRGSFEGRERAMRGSFEARERAMRDSFVFVNQEAPNQGKLLVEAREIHEGHQGAIIKIS
jgi:hypothetical protein